MTMAIEMAVRKSASKMTKKDSMQVLQGEKRERDTLGEKRRGEGGRRERERESGQYSIDGEVLRSVDADV